jgi:hypothetical protein
MTSGDGDAWHLRLLPRLGGGPEGGMATGPGERRRRFVPPRLAVRLALVAGGTLVGLLLAELLLAALDRPRFYKPHSFPTQFWFLPSREGEVPRYVNAPSCRIRFVYDGNPRGYFGPANEVDHLTNRLGFRGPEFRIVLRDGVAVADKPAGTVRLVFLGDSFTFGAGVRDEDTYPARAAALLQERHPTPPPRFEAYNFGVGGYNTTQSLWLLESLGLPALPDGVVLGYVLNDAEPPLFEVDPVTRGRRRAARPVEEGAGDPEPDGWLYRLRTARAVWQLFANRARTRRTVDHYRALYEDDSPGWQESRRALREIIARCAKARVPCCVLLFPVLHELNDRYPFRTIHEKIRREVADTDAVFIDLFPRLKGMRAEDLWVHPADQHPNEKVHLIAAQALVAEFLAGREWPTEAGSAPP